MADSKETTFYFPMGDPADGETRDIVFVTRQQDGTWSSPQKLGPEINSNAAEDNPHITEDGRLLFWTSTRKDGFGRKDIWFSIKGADGKWSQAANMGSNINSDADEDQFWISPDMKTAYFNRGTAIMTTRWDGKEWTKAEAVKFASPIMAAEPSLTADGKTMCLAVIDVNRRDIVISLSHLGADGVWSTPVPVD